MSRYRRRLPADSDMQLRGKPGQWPRASGKDAIATSYSRLTRTTLSAAPSISRPSAMACPCCGRPNEQFATLQTRRAFLPFWSVRPG